MIRFILGFVASVAITNWAYQEMAVFDPHARNIIDSLSADLTPPTHDKWFGGAVDGLSFNLEDTIQNVSQNANEYVSQFSIFHVTDRLSNIKRLVNQKRRGNSVSSRDFRQEIKTFEPYQMVSDDDIFVRHL